MLQIVKRGDYMKGEYLSLYTAEKLAKLNKLETNWKMLVMFLVDTFNETQETVYLDILLKMKELEGKNEN
jgi:hypothetical protein